jgi:hypothetical protein
MHLNNKCKENSNKNKDKQKLCKLKNNNYKILLVNYKK